MNKTCLLLYGFYQGKENIFWSTLCSMNICYLVNPVQNKTGLVLLYYITNQCKISIQIKFVFGGKNIRLPPCCQLCSYNWVALTGLSQRSFSNIISLKSHKLNKNSGIKSWWSYAQLHMMSLLHIKFHKNLISSLREVALTRLLMRIYGKFLSSKGHNSCKNERTKISW